VCFLIYQQWNDDLWKVGKYKIRKEITWLQQDPSSTMNAQVHDSHQGWLN